MTVSAATMPVLMAAFLHELREMLGTQREMLRTEEEIRLC